MNASLAALLLSTFCGATEPAPQVIFVDRLPNGANAHNDGRDAIIMVRDEREIGAIFAQELQEVLAHRGFDPVERVEFNNDDDRRAYAQLFSHAVEVAAAEALYGRNPNRYRSNEAEDMRESYSYLSGFSESKIFNEMLMLQPAARRWVADHRSELACFVVLEAFDRAQRLTEPRFYQP